MNQKTTTLSHEQQTELTRLTIWVAQLLMSNGAESRLIDQLTVRLGHALGCKNMQLALTSNAITLSTIINDRCVTTVRQVHHAVINMNAVSQLMALVLAAEKNEITMVELRSKLENLSAPHFHPWLIVLAVAISCASFAALAGGDLIAVFITFMASGVAMRTRQYLVKHKHNPLITFACTAFVSTMMVSAQLQWLSCSAPNAAYIASVLLLVPGFPLTNAVLDLVKGYFVMGLARLGMSTLLTLFIAIGIVTARILSKSVGWL